MITQDDIDALSEGNAAMNAVETRILEGVTKHREIMPRELRPFIKAALAWRRAAINLWDEKLRAGEDAMRLHHADSKYVRKETGQ